MVPGSPEGFERLMSDAGELGICEHDIVSCFFANRAVSYWRFDGTNYFVAGSLRDPEAAPVIDDAGRPALFSPPKDETRKEIRAEILAAHAQRRGTSLRRVLHFADGATWDTQILADFQVGSEGQGSLVGVTFEAFAPFKMVAVSDASGDGSSRS